MTEASARPLFDAQAQHKREMAEAGVATTQLSPQTTLTAVDVLRHGSYARQLYIEHATSHEESGKFSDWVDLSIPAKLMWIEKAANADKISALSPEPLVIGVDLARDGADAMAYALSLPAAVPAPCIGDWVQVVYQDGKVLPALVDGEQGLRPNVVSFENGSHYHRHWALEHESVKTQASIVWRWPQRG